jgi:hypothetical protein
MGKRVKKKIIGRSMPGIFLVNYHTHSNCFYKSSEKDHSCYIIKTPTNTEENVAFLR